MRCGCELYSHSTGDPTLDVSYEFTGATTGSGSGTGSGSTFNLGVTTVTITAHNICSPDATCSFTITVNDDEAPVVTCPVTGNADRNADAGVCSYTVQGTEFDATATDNCTLSTLTYTLSGATTGNGTTLAGVIFGSGQTTVTWTGEDAAGNSSSCSFTVTVLDNQPPGVTCPVTGNADRNADAGVCSYTVQGTEFDVTATDNCGVSSLTYILSGATTGTGTNLAGVIFGSGQTTVTWTAGDAAGNSSSCSFTVTIADHEAPAVVCPVTGNADRSADAGVCSYTVQGTEFDATATDNCTLSTLTYTLSGATTGNGTTLAGVIFGSGQTTVTWMAEDAAGNSSSCSFTVTIADHEAPVVTCPITGNADRNADAGGM